MKKYIALLRYEFRTIIKDPLSIFMLFYPVVMLFIMGVFIPLLFDQGENANAQAITMLIILTVALSMGGFIAGALLGFSFLENKDENTIVSIAVSPIRVGGYTSFKIIYSYVLAYLGNLILIGGLKVVASDAYTIVFQGQTISLLDNIGWGKLLIFSVVNSMMVPTIALFFASVAKNKVEGFAMMKSSGMIIMLPALTLINFFQDGKQYLLGILPNFWTIKAMLNDANPLLVNDANLGFYGYLLIGAVYSIVLGILMFRLFMKKVNVK